ncbi:MAG: peptidase C39 family protein [Alphaproteobacteria bacterium]|nr:peptidase C39 family protein [Alphaproteobacteria bacterium]
MLRETADAVVLRPGFVSDVPALVALEEACFEIDRLSRRSFIHMLTRANASLFVAESDTGLLGYGLVLFHAGTALARLYSLAVHPAARGHGLGNRLLDAAEIETRTHDAVALRLEVMTENVAAIALYEHRGYRRLAALPHYYEDGSDGWRYEKPLRWRPNPTLPQMPYVHQTMPFTCGSASLMMAMAGLDPERGIDPDDEIRIWREATTVFMTSGHGGCGPHGLALAAHRRGFDVRIVVSEPGPLFLDSVRSAAKKAVMEKVHQIFERDLVTAGLIPTIAATTPEDLEVAIAEGWVPLLLVSSWSFNREKTPHWVVVTGIDDRFLLVHDPDMDEDLMKTDVDCTHVPIPRSAFATMARYGRAGLRAAVYVRHREGGA